MKKFAAVAVLTAGAVALPSVALADEGGTFRVRGGLAAVNYSSPSGASSPDLESSYAALTLGGSFVSSNGWFADLGYRTSLSAEYNAQEVFAADKDDEFDRNETTLSVGKGLGAGFAVFGGIQLAKNEFKAQQTNFAGTAKINLTTDSTVYFAGGSKAFTVGNGALSVSAALGLMKQEMDVTGSGPGGTASASAKSDTGFGFSLGAAYNLPLSKNLSLLGDLRYQTYEVDYSGSSQEETVTSLGVSVVAQF